MKILYQISANAYKNDVLLQKTPLALSFLYLIKQFRNNEKNSKIYDEPNLGTGDKDLSAYLTNILSKDPDYPLPPTFQKVTDYEISLVYKIPKILHTKKSTKISLEILDGIFFKSLGIHLIFPQILIEKKIVAKGINIKANSNLPILPLFLPTSSEIKYWILRLGNKLSTDLLVETGKVLEDLLTSVANNEEYKSSAFIHKQIVNTFLRTKEMQNIENNKKLEKAEKLRKQRKQELNDLLKQKKKEIENKELEENKKIEEAKQLENKKLMEIEEKRQKQILDKKKRLEEWKNQKAEEEKVKEAEKLKEKQKETQNFKEKNSILKNIKNVSALILPNIAKTSSDLQTSKKVLTKGLSTPVLSLKK